MRRCLFFLLLAAAFASCKKEKDIVLAERKGILLVGNGVDLEDLDPQTDLSVNKSNVLLALYEGLVSEDPRDLHAVPGVAKSWDLSADGLVYTFHLRENARWSNGEPVTAEDFYESYRRILTPEFASESASSHYFVKNAEAFATGKITDFTQVGYRVIDPLTFQITLANKTPFFLEVLTGSPFYPIHPPTVRKFGGLVRKATFWTKPGNCVTNGPFILVDWRPQSVVRCLKSPTYWDAQTVRLNGIDFFPIESTNTEERAFRSGQIHKTATLPLSKIDYYKREHPQLLRIDPYSGSYFYSCNVTRPPLDNPQVRQALSLAIDREKIVQKITRGGQTPAGSFTPQGTGGFSARTNLHYDPVRARTLLAEAGYPDGKGMPPLDILFNTSESHRTIAEAIQEMWKTVLHIDVNLTNQEWKVYLDSEDTLNFQISRRGWIGSYDEPQAYFYLWVTKGGYNNTGWSSPEYDALFARLQLTSAPAARAEIFNQMNEILVESGPLLPIYWYTQVFLIRPEVEGWYPNLLDSHPYKYVHFAEPKAGVSQNFAITH